MSQQSPPAAIASLFITRLTRFAISNCLVVLLMLPVGVVWRLQCRSQRRRNKVKRSKTQMYLSTVPLQWCLWTQVPKSAGYDLSEGIHANSQTRPVNNPPLIVETPEEKRLYALGERNSEVRKERRNTSLIKHTPNDLESDLIHAFWQKQLQYHGQSHYNCAEAFLKLAQTLMMNCESRTIFTSWIQHAFKPPQSCSRNSAIATIL